MARMTKRITDGDRQILSIVSRSIPEEVKWFYEEVKKKRSTITDEMLKALENQLGPDGVLRLSHICKLMNWEFPRDKEPRNRLASLATNLLIHQSEYAAPLLLQVLKRSLKEDVEDPTDFFLAKKAARIAQKRKEHMKATGAIKDVASETDKTAARKERARIRKEAKKLGITPKEYKEKMAKDSKKEAA